MDKLNAPLAVLVVDDEPSICWGFERLLASEGFQVWTAGSAEAGLEIARSRQIALVLLDIRLPGISGLDALPEFQRVTSDAPVIVMTAFGDLDTAVTAVQRGATDYLTKPFRLDDASEACQRALRRRLPADAPPAVVMAGDDRGIQLVGRSAAMQRLFREIALVAASDLSVLIRGETGTGKELVAAAIHRHSKRRDQPYIAVAPVAFNQSLIESELFGHARGAFTGATENRRGVFEAVGEGTILLDEIGDLPLGSQVKLLRVLERRQFTPVGEVTLRPFSGRVLAATHRDLRQGVADSTFREDLLYRLSGMTLEIPPLRDRPEDIAPLVLHFLENIGYPRAAEAVDAELFRQLESRPWLGNVRELRHAVERAAVVARGRRLDVSDFAESDFTPGSTASDPDPATTVSRWTRNQLEQGDATELYERFLKASEPALFRTVLESVGGNRAAAAETLGMSRATLRERLKRYRIE